MKASAWVIIPRPQPGARLRLFCFPYAGGAASIFRTWPDELPSSVEVCPVQLPGREERLVEPPFERLAPLTQALLSALRPYLDRPFAFFGHSMGALIGFELARQLRRQKSSAPVHLFVAGRRAPHVPPREPPIYHLPEAEFVAELRRLEGTPEAVLQNAELMQLFLPLLRADFAVNETFVYTPEAPLACPISAFGGLEDDRANEEELAAWGEQTSGAFRLRMLPGGHFFIHSVQPSLLRSVAQDLA